MSGMFLETARVTRVMSVLGRPRGHVLLEGHRKIYNRVMFGFHYQPYYSYVLEHFLIFLPTPKRLSVSVLTNSFDWGTLSHPSVPDREEPTLWEKEAKRGERKIKGREKTLRYSGVAHTTFIPSLIF